MNKSLLTTLLVAGLALAGCGKKEETAAAPAASTAVAPAGRTLVVEITANDAMKYSITRIEAAPGQEVKLTLTNTGNMPKAAMAHNWVLLKKGVDSKGFTNAAVMAMANDYFPADRAGEVIAHTKLLGPKQSEEVVFKAPTEPGEYVYLCSFPAHYAAGMHGVLVVK